MIENRIVAAQFGVPGKPLVASDGSERFGMPDAIGGPATEVLRREAALLLAENGLCLAAIARHLGLGPAETAEALGPSSWRFCLSDEEADDDDPVLAWHGGGGFRPLSAGEMHVLTRDLDGAGRLAVRRLKAGSRKSDAIEKLIRSGFLRRCSGDISITAQGEALLYRVQTERP